MVWVDESLFEIRYTRSTIDYKVLYSLTFMVMLVLIALVTSTGSLQNFLHYVCL